MVSNITEAIALRYLETGKWPVPYQLFQWRHEAGMAATFIERWNVKQAQRLAMDWYQFMSERRETGCYNQLGQ